MARIRSIKPDFWTDEKVVELSPWERLLFIGLWNFCDDQGYIDDKPRRIKMQVFPGDDMSVAEVEKMMANLVTAGILDEYDSPIGPVLHVRHWDRHQRVDRPSAPRFDADSLTPRRVLAEASSEAREAQNAVPARQWALNVVTEPILLRENGIDEPNSGGEEPNSTRPRRGLDEASLPSLDAEGKGREGKGSNSSPTSSSKRVRATDDPDFDRFWSIYPRKEGKKDAQRAWPTAVKAAKGANAIIAAAARYRDRRRGQNPQFTKTPAAWLNGERWNDEPLVPIRVVGSATGGAFWDN